MVWETQDMLSMSDIGVMTYDDGGIYDGDGKTRKDMGKERIKNIQKIGR